MNELNILIEALNLATTKGVYNLKDTETILNAIAKVKALLEDKQE